MIFLHHFYYYIFIFWLFCFPNPLYENLSNVIYEAYLRDFISWDFDKFNLLFPAYKKLGVMKNDFKISTFYFNFLIHVFIII